MEVLTKMLDKEQEDAFKQIGELVGVDLLGMVQAKAAAETKRLEEAGVAHKELEDATPEDDIEKEPGAEVVDTGVNVEAIAERVADIFHLDSLSKGFEGQNEAIGEIAKAVAVIGDRLGELEKGDLEKAAEATKWTPQFAWHRASQAKGTVLDDEDETDKKLKGQQPATPIAISSVTDAILGGRR
jgi:hypothetical protein